MASNEFNEEAKKILKRLQEVLTKSDQKIIRNIRAICKQFIKLYDKNLVLIIEELKRLQEEKERLKNVYENDPELIKSLYAKQKQKNLPALRQTVGSLVNASRQLETLLTGFKMVFLRLIGQQFVQRIVIEDEEGRPIIIQLQDLSSMAAFIEGKAQDLQGKLKSNQDMLTMINKKQHSDLYTKIWTAQPYIQIYMESRRRLNIFYDKVKKGARHGEGLLLYKPHGEWLKFYVLNLGDLKEGYISMTTHQPKVFGNMEYNIETFTDYIGQVDNIIGTLIQDVQYTINESQVNLQISVKSGSASTGAHDPLIQLIRDISRIRGGNTAQKIIDLIQESFNIDNLAAKEGKGQRDKILNDEQAKDKIATMMYKNSEKKAKKNIEEYLQKSGFIITEIEQSI